MSTNDEGSKQLLELLTDSYKEVLDATKHQDDKIGRLFTGISFLTAGALALANLATGTYLRQSYVGWEGWPPPAMLFLGAFLSLVVIAVMLLINSLATPLRVPGLSRLNEKPHVDWVNNVKASQLYFGEISKLGLKEWGNKWKGAVPELEIERAQALVGETHNLAVRTQFKYGRTSEAIAVFNLALLSLSLTIVFCLTASTVTSGTLGAAELPHWARYALGATVAIFYFLQLQGQVRYSRQTMDELSGRANRWGALIRYVWVVMATLWAYLVGSGVGRSSVGSACVYIVGAVGLGALFLGTGIQRHTKRKVESQGGDSRAGDDAARWVDWIGCGVALTVGIALTVLHERDTGPWSTYGGSLSLALAGALALTALGFLSPTMALLRNSQKFKKREAELDVTAALAPEPGGDSSGSEDVAEVGSDSDRSN